ncbi:hypothetical protein [Pseudanabaena mucicola]|nr:hypothetical protein [Pseudanabaena mucicola]
MIATPKTSISDRSLKTSTSRSPPHQKSNGDLFPPNVNVFHI